MTNLSDLKRLIGKEEDLHPDLVPRLVQASIGRMIHHPILVEPFYDESLNAVYNERYRLKSEATAYALGELDWGSYIAIHERPYRLEALLRVSLLISDVDHWRAIGDVWTDSENIFENLGEWHRLWGSKRPDRDRVMDEDERVALKVLPAVFEVWRGTGFPETVGLSWTLNMGIAEDFARRAGGRPCLLHGWVERRRVRALLLSRDEAEVVCLPRDVKDIQKHTVKVR